MCYRRGCPSGALITGSPVRTAPIWPSYCSKRLRSLRAHPPVVRRYWRIAHLGNRITLLPGDPLDQLAHPCARECVAARVTTSRRCPSCLRLDQPMLTGEFNSQGVTRPRSRSRGGPSIRILGLVVRDTARCAKCRRRKRRRSIRVARTACPRSSRTTSRSTNVVTTFRRVGDLFNHERRGAASSSSPARSPTASPGSLGLADHLALGNLDAHRDWGFAGDYVRAMGDAAAEAAGRLRHRHGQRTR